MEFHRAIKPKQIKSLAALFIISFLLIFLSQIDVKNACLHFSFLSTKTPLSRCRCMTRTLLSLLAEHIFYAINKIYMCF